MMDNELRAAASRVRNSEASGINHHDIYGYSLNVDLAILGRAWLADHHADDGEPVTGDWLVSIGGVFTDLSWQRQPPSLGFGEPSNGYIFAGSLGFRAGAGWHAYHLDADGFSGSESYLCPVPNRGRARQLLSALGIPTTPEANG